jgi:O-antigen ligase
MFVVLVGAVRGVRDVERLAFAYLAGVAIYAAVVLSRFKLSGTDWRLASLYDYDANEFATLIAISLPLAVYFAFRPGPLWRRMAALGAGGVLAVGFIWAGSRGGFLAVLAVGGYLLAWYRGMRVGFRIAATGLIALVFITAASDSFWSKMTTILSPDQDYNVTAESGRVQVWKRGVGYMLSHPVLGVGAGNFPVAEGTISPLLHDMAPDQGLKWSAAHNSYLEVGAELGVPGLLLFLAMLWRTFRGLSRVAGRTPPARSPPPGPLSQTLTAALIGYVVGAFFLSLAYRDLLYVLIALAVGLHKVVTTPPTPARGRP